MSFFADSITAMGFPVERLKLEDFAIDMTPRKGRHRSNHPNRAASRVRPRNSLQGCCTKECELRGYLSGRRQPQCEFLTESGPRRSAVPAARPAPAGWGGWHP